MPGDLLRYLSGPTPYSWWWLAGGVMIAVAAIVWSAGVLVWTMPAQRLRRILLIRSLHGRVVRRKFAGAVRGAREDYRAGKLSAAQAAAVIRRSVRSFLAVTTGEAVRYMHVADIQASDLAPAAPLFRACNDAQFNAGSGVDVDGIGQKAEELIQSWS
jgi:hypothetical protein